MTRSLSTLAHRIMLLADGTKTRKEIAETVGCGLSTVDSTLVRLREQGINATYLPIYKKGTAATIDFIEANPGKSRSELAAMLGIPISRVQYAIAHARLINRPLIVKKEQAAKMDEKYSRKEYKELLESLPPPIREWLISAMPDGAALADVIRSIITDQYYEENPNE